MADEKPTDDKADDKPAPKKGAKPAKKPKPFSEAGWNAFGAVMLAGFAFAVFGMGMASLFKPGIATVMTMAGGLAIFALSGIFAKMAVTEFGRELTKKSATPTSDADGGEDKKDDKKSASGRR